MEFDIYKIINNLKTKRTIFYSEADFQFAISWVIKEIYPDAKIRLEYNPKKPINMRIDILVIFGDKWIPIELKYKTKGSTKIIDNEEYHLKNHGAKDRNCYFYLKDIERIENLKDQLKQFDKGYSIFLTNDLSYIKAPQRETVFYKQFSLEDNTVISGKLSWHENTGSGTMKGIDEAIFLKNNYKIKWQNYSKLDDTITGTFKILINEIK